MDAQLLTTYAGFSIGDVAVLNSGGPDMTVTGFQIQPGAQIAQQPAGAPAIVPPQPRVDCVWFGPQDAMVRMGTFAHETLTLKAALSDRADQKTPAPKAKAA